MYVCIQHRYKTDYDIVIGGSRQALERERWLQGTYVFHHPFEAR